MEVVLAFPDQKRCETWCALLRSFTKLELDVINAPRVSSFAPMGELESALSAIGSASGNSRRDTYHEDLAYSQKARICRRLEISILDAGKLVLPESPTTEAAPVSPAAGGGFLRSISMGFEDLLSKDGMEKGGSSREKHKLKISEPFVEPRLRVEVYLDGRLMARTSTRDDLVQPLWSEDAFLEDIPRAETCTVDLVFSDEKGITRSVGYVDLRLGDFEIGSVYERRHVLRSELGEIAGEIRLKLRREELHIHRPAQYEDLQRVSLRSLSATNTGQALMSDICYRA